MADVIGVYAPMLAYTGAIFAIFVITLFFIRGARGGTSSIVLLLVIMVVGITLLGGGVVLAVTGALRRGVYVTGEVLGPGRLRVKVQGQDAVVALGARGSYKPGDRLDVMMDPQKKTVLLSLGAPTT